LKEESHSLKGQECIT